MTGWLSVWRGRQGAAAIGVLLVMVVVRGRLLAGSYFNQDDFYMTGRAYESDLTWEYLFRDFAGHVNPLQQLTLWLVAHQAPYQWPVLAVAILVVETAATVLVWLILTRLLGERWSRVVLLVVFAWSPLTLAPTLWWSASMFLWPHVLCSLTAIWLLVRWRQGGSGRLEMVGIVLVTVVGLLWHERAVLIPPLVFGVAVAMADEAQGWRRLVAALSRFRWLWVSLTVVLVGFLVGHGLLTDVEGGGGTVRQQLGVSWSFLAENAVPGLAGGPWAGEVDGGAVRPADWVTAVSLVLATATAGFLLLRGGPARRWALAVLLGYVAADLGLLLSGRASFGPIIGLDPRYSSDIVHAAVVCLALALRDSPRRFGLARPTWRRWRVPAVVTVIAAYGVAAAFGTALLVPQFQNTEDRAFVTNLRDELAADPTQVILDDAAPVELVLPLVGEDARFSRIFGPLPERPVFDQPSPRLRVVDEDGRLQPIVFDGSIQARPGPDGPCGYAVTAGGAWVPFAAPVAGRVVLRVRYFSQHEATVRVATAGWETEFLARRGPNEIWMVLPDLDREVRSLTFESDGGPPVCVTDVHAGLPEAP